MACQPLKDDVERMRGLCGTLRVIVLRVQTVSEYLQVVDTAAFLISELEMTLNAAAKKN